MTEGRVEQHLNNVFFEAAKEFEKSSRGVLYKYRFYSRDIMRPELIASGYGHIVGVRYDRSLDCDVYTLEDTTTRERYTGNQFRFYLEEGIERSGK